MHPIDIAGQLPAELASCRMVVVYSDPTALRKDRDPRLHPNR
jgi:hypothetical protein